MSNITDMEARSLKDGQTITEKLGRNRGTFLIRRRGQSYIAFYRYFSGKTKREISLGSYRYSTSAAGFSLKEIRERAVNLANIRQAISPADLKSHLEKQAEEQQQQAQVEAQKGSFADLLDAYVDDLRKRGKDKEREYSRIVQKDIKDPYPNLAGKKAKDVTADDIVTILAKVHNRGSENQANCVRAMLHAAFSFGSKSDYDHTRVGEKRFYLTHNPVAMTKKNTQVEKSRVRVLNNREIHQLWHNIKDAPEVGIVISLCIQFLIATGGQRPSQLLRAKWVDYDFERNCVSFENKKRKGEALIHTIPLTPRALDIIAEVREYTSHLPWPFAFQEAAPVRTDSLSTALDRWHRYRTRLCEQSGDLLTARYTPSCLRDTAKSLMIDAGINREVRNLIQSHQLTGVDYEHYDRHEHLSEKREGMERYDGLLSNILTTPKPPRY
ncbi:tyrosine-type recombinase/integrase [Endozoicomonas sp. ALB032]|uniref:tyrosine-type recombinase/integrase n=1 Tax=Endozoicomonas sp. ALB032 TaxID=3403082 RepID=UPI003BB7FCD6